MLSQRTIGDAIVRGVVGIILLLETNQAIAILGIVWAVFFLNDVAKEINDYYKTRKSSGYHNCRLERNEDFEKIRNEVAM
ncbi:MAG: hypothetical protein IJ695_04205 [Butyrivibrio sp.]|nr:hypothetical protein [Butyrivibrio sp.]